MMPPFVPVHRPLLGEEEQTYLLECVRSGWISSEGPFVRKFEETWAARVGRRYGVAVCNGTAALELAVAALDIGPGDEVILPAFTILSCAAAVVRRGAKPVLVDVDPDVWTMRVDQIEARVTPRTRAVMAVHTYGLPVDMDAVLAIAQRHGLAVIEDAAEAHGQMCRGRPCGSFGDVSIFSFYSNKDVATGEGGMVLTDRPELAERCRTLRNLGFGKEERRFVHEELGWNFRLSNLQAAVGLAQIERLDATLTRKRAIGARYTRQLEGTKGLQLPRARTELAVNGYWVYGVVLGEEVPFAAAEAMRRLAQIGIGTRPFFWPMHRQPVFQRMGFFREERYPVSERLGERGFYLPAGPGITDEEVDRAAAALREVMDS